MALPVAAFIAGLACLLLAPGAAAIKLPSIQFVGSTSGLTPPQSRRSRRGGTLEGPEVLYVVGPSPVDKGRRELRVQAILDTYAPSGQAVFLSNQSVAGETVWNPPEEPSNTAEGWAWLLKRSLSNTRWQWLMRIDDVSVVIDRNLKAFLRQHDPKKAVMIGSMLRQTGSNLLFPSAGPGWILSRAAVEEVLTLEEVPKTRWLETHYDIFMLDRLGKMPGVASLDGLDPEGAPAFNVYGPVKAFYDKYDDWYRNYKANVPEEVRSGMACCAAYPISFHYLAAEEIRAVYDVINNRTKWAAMSVSERDLAWPRGAGKVLAYSKALARGGEDPAWELLLKKFRLHDD